MKTKYGFNFLNEDYSRVFNSTLDFLQDVVAEVVRLKNLPNMRFNLSELAFRLGIPDEQIQKLASVILLIQSKLREILPEYKLVRVVKTRNETEKKLTYFEIQRTGEERSKSKNLDILISHKELEELSDIVVFNKKMKTGFPVKAVSKSNGYSRKVIALRKKHPYLFVFNGKDKFYPTELAERLVEKINRDKTLKRKITSFTILKNNIEIV